jgi:hypothetical protein
LEAQAGQFLLGCKCPRGIVVQEQDPIGDIPAAVFFQNVLSREVGRAKDLSAPRVTKYGEIGRSVLRLIIRPVGLSKDGFVSVLVWIGTDEPEPSTCVDGSCLNPC